MRNYIQGYNAQPVVHTDQIVLAAEITNDPGDFSHLQPMITSMLSGARAGRQPTGPRWARRRRRLTLLVGICRLTTSYPLRQSVAACPSSVPA